MDRGEDRIAHAWRQVDDYVAALPPGMRERARLLLVDVELWWSRAGRVEGVRGSWDDLPVLESHLRLADDLDLGSGTAALTAVSRSTVMTLMLVHLLDGIRLPGSAFDRTWVSLADDLARAITVELTKVAGPSAAWRDLHTASWRRFHEADDTDPGTGDDVLTSGSDRLAPFLVGAAYAAGAAGREDLMPSIIRLLDDLHAAESLRQDLRRLRSDLARGRISPVVAWASRQMEVEPDLASTEEMAGALLLSGAAPPLAERCGSRLTQSRAAAEELGLGSVAELISRVDAALAELARLFDVGRHPTHRPAPSPRRSAPVPSELLDTSIDAAQRYLRADPSFREAWEIHRWGLGGYEEVAAPFPAGLVLEILARRGRPVGDSIDAFVASVRDRNLAYYDHPDLPQIETDTLGVLLRLHRWGGDRTAHARLVEEYLDLLEGRIGAEGDIPVWLSDGDDTILLGEGCGGIAAGVIVGLLEYDPEGRRKLIEVAGRRLLERFTQRGTSISVNYPAAFTLAGVARLLGLLRSEGVLADMWKPAEEALAVGISREAAGLRPGAQRAALLVTASLQAETTSVSPEWIGLLVERQHSDGRWSGEPLFFVPHRARSVTWYARDLTTSALCYDALVGYRDSL